MKANWVEWARRLNSLAQTGLTYAENPYDRERYTAIRTIAAEMVVQGAGAETTRCSNCSPATPGTPRRR